jgi:hypothetical protein
MTIGKMYLEISYASLLVCEARTGAAGGDRTHDPWLRRPILYPLSYSRNAENNWHPSPGGRELRGAYSERTMVAAQSG